MSETITETILPGTYIDVRAEGLIGVGGIATGNVGIVGTAQRGPIGQVVTLGSGRGAIDEPALRPGDAAGRGTAHDAGLVGGPRHT